MRPRVRAFTAAHLPLICALAAALLLLTWADPARSRSNTSRPRRISTRRDRATGRWWGHAMMAVKRGPSAGFTLIEVLISVTLVSLLAVGMMVAMRVGLSAMTKAVPVSAGTRR